MNITTLGEARFVSPQRHTVSDQARVPCPSHPDARRPAGGIPPVRTGRAARPPVLRSAANPRRHCHLRRAVPRSEQRHPLAVSGTASRLRRAGSPRLSRRLPGSRPGARPGTGRADAGFRPRHSQGRRHGAGHLTRSGRYRPGGGQPDPARREHPVHPRRRRHPARRQRPVPGSPAARPSAGGRRHSQDD